MSSGRRVESRARRQDKNRARNPRCARVINDAKRQRYVGHRKCNGDRQTDVCKYPRVSANDRARDLLREGDDLLDRDGVLHARPPDADAVLQGLLARALPPYGERGAGGAMTLRRSTDRPGLALHVSPVGDGEAGFRPSGVAALVLVAAADVRTRIDPELVGAALGLTPTESRVAAWASAIETR